MYSLFLCALRLHIYQHSDATVHEFHITVLAAKSDSGVMFCLQSFYGPIIEISLVY